MADRSLAKKPKTVRPFISLVELDKVIAEARGVRGRASKVVEAEYWKLISSAGNELSLLLDKPLAEISQITTVDVAEGINRLRQGKVYSLVAGYDGEYGKVNLFSPTEIKKPEQETLF